MKVLVLTNKDHIVFIIEYLTELDANGCEFFIKSYGECDWSEDYDIGVSFMYQYRVPKEELTKPWFNFHPAPLPEYKGRNLCYHAIMNGETEFGATLHYMDENFDTGDIIEVWRFPITTWDTAQSLSDITIEKSKWQFGRYFPRIIAGEQFERLPNVGGTYYKKEPIEDYIGLNNYQDKKVRAITYGDFYPKIDIGGVTYKIVRDE